MGLFLGAAALVVGGVGGAAAGADLAVSPSAAGAGPGRPGEGVEGRPTADLNVLVRDDADDGDGDGPGAGPSAHPTTTALPRPSGSRPGNPDPSRSSRPSEGSGSPSTSPTPGPHEPGAPDESGESGESGEAHGGDERDGLPQDDPATRHPDSGLPSLAAEPGGADGGTATRTETLVGTQAGTLPPAPSRSLSPSGSGFRPYGDARAGAEPGAGRESASAAVRGSAQADVAAGGFQQSRVLPFGTGLALIGLGAAVLGVRLRRS